MTIPGVSQTVPNGSFESWKPVLGVEQPVGWFTSSSFTPDSDPKPVVKTTDKQDGEFALHLETVKTRVGGQDQIVQGMAVTGKIDLTSGPVVGFPLNGKPEKLRFYYKYQPLFNDSMAIILTVTKQGYSEPIGVAAFSTSELINQYTMADLTITYFSNEMPDSASISIFSGQDTVMPGSLLIVDNMTFEGGMTGIDGVDLSAVQFGNPYPNPARGETWFPTNLSSTQKITLQLFDLAGKELIKSEKTLHPGDAGMTLNTRGLVAGIYLYRLSTANSNAQGKLVVTE